MADVELELEQHANNNIGRKPAGHHHSDDKLHFIGSQIVLRSLVISSTLAATAIIVTAKQSVLIFGLPFDARYSYSPAFKYFAFANAFASAFSLLSLFFLFVSTRGHFPPPTNYYILFLHDLLMMGLVLSGCAAATAIGYVGKYGNDHTAWSPICDHFGKFCNRVTISASLSYLAVLCLLLLTVLSATSFKSAAH